MQLNQLWKTMVWKFATLGRTRIKPSAIALKTTAHTALGRNKKGGME